jgi:hypothetical protein
VTLPPFILGHNALIGVHHADRASAGVKHALSKRDHSLLDTAADVGVRAVLLDNHPVALEAARYLADRHPEVTVVPMVPYAQAVVDRASSGGMTAVARQIVSSGVRSGAALVRALTDFARGRLVDAGARIAVAHYLSGFPDRRPPVCFLHNAVTDLMLGWGNREGLSAFAGACRSIGVTPGFVTLNPGALGELAGAVGDEAWYMCAVNSRGIQMSPSREEGERMLQDRRLDVVAMSVLGGGLLDPAAEIARAYEFPVVRSVVIGTSNEAHLREVVGLADSANASRKAA